MNAKEARAAARKVNESDQYTDIKRFIEQESKKGNLEMWYYKEIHEDLKARLRKEGFKVGPDQWDRNEYLIKISW